MKIFVSTADASGDLHAAGLIEALRKRESSLEVFGLGGAALEAMGQRSIVAQREIAIGGLVEVVSSLPRLLRAYRALRRALAEESPDVAVLVDSPDLNLPLASVARRLGIPVLYYVAPQVWAWRMGRVRKLRRRVDHVAVIFPFEEAVLREAGVPATFVGHPLVERIAAFERSFVPENAAKALGIDRGRPVLGLLPGSRQNELSANLPVMFEAALLAQRLIPELQILLVLAPTVASGEPELSAAASLLTELRTVRGSTYEAMALSGCLLCAPGTATVEAALLRTPHIVTHRTNWLSFELIRRFSRVPSACMLNLIAGQDVIPERLQAMARPAPLAALVAKLLSDRAAAEAMVRDLDRAVEWLGPAHASDRAADLVLEVAKRI